MDYGETYLHHYFAGDRIGGEWFDLDDAGLVISDVRPLSLTPSRLEMAAVAGSFRRWKELNDVPRTTERLALPRQQKQAGAKNSTTAYEELTVAKAILDTHKTT